MRSYIGLLVALCCGCGGNDFSSSADGTAADAGGARAADAAGPLSSQAPSGSGAAPGLDAGASQDAPVSSTPPTRDAAVSQDAPVSSTPPTRDAAVSPEGSDASDYDAAPEPACPMPPLTPLDMPSRIVWESFFYQKGPECVLCAQTPCGDCPVAWFPVEQEGDRVTATINYQDCNNYGVPIREGPCGSELQCTAWTLIALEGNVISFTLVPDATGWHVADLSSPYFEVRVSTVNRGTCGSPVITDNGATVTESFTEDYIAQMEAMRWDCP